VGFIVWRSLLCLYVVRDHHQGAGLSGGGTFVWSPSCAWREVGIWLGGGGIGDGEDAGYIDGGIIIILRDDILSVMQVGVKQHHSPMHVVMMRYASFPKRVSGQFGIGTP
jgi:hypothetical protein